MADRLYIPSAYIDDVCPRGRANPDDWIGALTGDFWLLATEDGFDFGLTLTPGATMRFAWTEDLGDTRWEAPATAPQKTTSPVRNDIPPRGRKFPGDRNGRGTA